MKSMLAVAQLVSQQKLRKIDILTEDVLNAKNSKFRELYLGLRDGTIRSDREAAQKLYKADPSDTRYRQLKSRFRKRLLNTLFFVDQSRPHRSSFDTTYHNCQRDWSLINILRVNGAEEPALQMAKSLLTVCQNYGFSELTVQTARFLANHETQEGHVKSAKQFEGIIRQANQTYQVELVSESLLRNARLLYSASSSAVVSPQVEDEVAQLIEEIDSSENISDNAVIFYNHIEARCLLGKTLNEKSKVISLVDEAIEYSLATPRQMQENRVWQLSTWQIQAFIECNEKERGIAALKKVELRCKSGTTAWFNIQKLMLSLFIRTNALAEAEQIVKLVKTNRKFNRLSAQEVETFALLEMLTTCFHQDFNGRLSASRKSNIDAFLRKEPIFGGDHQGLNAWRYLIKVILHHKLGNQIALSDTISDLRHLSVKQLDAKRDARLIALSQLLYRLERKQFKGGLDRVGERYFNQLEQHSFKCSIRPDSFNPIDVEDMLAFFGVNEVVALPA